MTKLDKTTILITNEGFLLQKKYMVYKREKIKMERKKCMGRNIYLTEKELDALRSVGSEWSLMMEDGDEESIKCVNEKLENGLGSAMKKLYKGLKGERVYKDY